MKSSFAIIFAIVLIILIFDSTKAGPASAGICCAIQCSFLLVGAAPCMATCATLSATCQGPCGAINCLAPTP